MQQRKSAPAAQGAQATATATATATAPLSLPVLLTHLLRRAWDEHDDEERSHHAHLARTDLRCLSALTTAYACSAWVFAPEVQVPERPKGVLAIQLALTTLALHNLYMELFVVVKAVKRDKMSFCAGKGPLGRWIWMTHQIIAVQAVHFAVSLLAPHLSERLTAGTYRFSVLLGGLGSFVTVQFFLLVYPTAAFTEECEIWTPRVPLYRLVQSYLHFPQLVLAVSDVCLLRHRGTLLLTSPPFSAIMLVYAAYCTAYIGAVHLNHTLTGYWPYGLMESLGSNLGKWLQFAVVQGTILSSFALALWILAHMAWALW